MIICYGCPPESKGMYNPLDHIFPIKRNDKVKDNKKNKIDFNKIKEDIKIIKSK